MFYRKKIDEGDWKYVQRMAEVIGVEIGLEVMIASGRVEVIETLAGVGQLCAVSAESDRNILHLVTMYGDVNLYRKLKKKVPFRMMQQLMLRRDKMGLTPAETGMKVVELYGLGQKNRIHEQFYWHELFVDDTDAEERWVGGVSQLVGLVQGELDTLEIAGAWSGRLRGDRRVLVYGR